MVFLIQYTSPQIAQDIFILKKKVIVIYNVSLKSTLSDILHLCVKSANPILTVLMECTSVRNILKGRLVIILTSETVCL